MIGTEIQSYVESRISRQLDSDDVLMAINEAIDMLGDKGLLYDTVKDIEVSDTKEWYGLPTDFTFVEKVLTENNLLYSNWNYRNGEINFPDENTYTVIARKMGQHLSNISDTITDLHRLYHNAIKFYVVGWFKENDDDQDPAIEKYYNRFEKTAQQAAQTLLRTKPPTNVKVIRHA